MSLVLLLAPAALLFAALLLGRYPGEAALARARGRRVAVPRPRPSTRVPVRRAPLLPRGGRLVGSAICARPPPARG